jgi:hypothetical protein
MTTRLGTERLIEKAISCAEKLEEHLNFAEDAAVDLGAPDDVAEALETAREDVRCTKRSLELTLFWLGNMQSAA